MFDGYLTTNTNVVQYEYENKTVNRLSNTTANTNTIRSYLKCLGSNPMKFQTLINKFRTERYNVATNRELIANYGISISRYASIITIKTDSEDKTKTVFHELAMFANKNFTVVQCPNHIWNIQQVGNLFIQEIEVYDEQ